DDALDAPEGSEYEKAMQDLSLVVTNGTDGFNSLTSLSLVQAQDATFNSYVRTPEMANALIGLQSIFSDQIQDRTRSFRRLNSQENGAAPRGAAGPEDWYGNSVDWMQNHLPGFDGRDAVRGVSDSAPHPEIKGDPSEVGKSYASGTTGKGSDYDEFKDSVNNLTPKASGEKIEVPETYQVWGRGYGSQLDQKAVGTHAGYDAQIAGGILGVDKRFQNILLGLGGGYARTILNGNAGNDGTANTGHVVGYFSTSGEKLFFDANLNYALSAVETEGLEAVGYKGEYDAQSVGFYVGSGYGMSAFNDNVLFTPEISLLSTYYDREAYTETSSIGFSDKAYDAYDQWSYLSALGATLSMIKQIESFNLEMEFQPELRVHWLHEFNPNMDDESYTMIGVPGGGQNISVSLQAREEDLVKVGGGVRFSQWDSNTTEFGLDLDGVFGGDYTAVIFSGKIMHRF
ncbi:MAG: autotransporter outer membrane beta-barrel domain-containing protein, partial [Pontiella sp.]